MENTTVKTPWKDSLGDLPFTLEYFQGAMWEGVEQKAKEYPHVVALDFMGRTVSYREMQKHIEECARSLRTVGVRPGDYVTIAMPNCPQIVYMFYAVNMIGAIACMVHPLSSEKELEFYVNETKSVMVVTLDAFYYKFEAVRKNTSVINIVVASISDELSLLTRMGYYLTDGRKLQKIPQDAPVIRWSEFLKIGHACSFDFKVYNGYDDPAVVLFSGGTTGTSKGILLTNGAFNSVGKMIVATNPMFRPGDKMLAAMPLFHGFGLGVCIHAMLFNGGRCLLVPRFTPKSYGRIMVKERCNFVAGVPTLYEALLRLPNMEGADLSALKGVYSGGDSLSIELKKKLDTFLYDHGASVQVREGYGATETVTACCLTPPHRYKEGSIGLPFPDTFFKIVKPGTEEEMPYGEEGEILVSGPMVMKEYLGHPDETAQTLRVHADGLRWLYTGDLGCMDNEGFVYFRGRIKRMIVSSGYNIYPAQIENIFDSCDLVSMSCCIGVPDSYRMHRIKVFIVPAAGVEPSERTKAEILKYASKRIAKYAMPKDLEFRAELPKTMVGKVAYRVLEEEEEAARRAKEAEEEKKAEEAK